MLKQGLTLIGTQESIDVMAEFPNFSAYGYEIVKPLGVNRYGARVTYQAVQITSQEAVVIKQFKFVSSESNWSDYKAVERELDFLKQLHHPGIPKYLDYFESEEGLCFVQEYKAAPNLSEFRSFELREIKQIASSVLEILQYLQKQTPSVVHRDLKPENILVDEDFRVYLVDFGFAKALSDELTSSSTVSGTMGFMPPEQLFNHSLSKSSDLYSLGVTLIALISGKKSSQVGELIDSQFQVDLSAIAQQITPEFYNWLETLTKPSVDERYPDAETALKKLQPLAIEARSEINLSHCAINLTANQIGETIKQAIPINNLIPETKIEGKWEVAPHTSDPPHTPNRHSWIAFEPANFSHKDDEEIICHLKVDTSQLKADQEYQRTLLLHNQSESKTYAIPIRVKTAPIPLSFSPFPNYGFLIFLCLVGIATALISNFGSLALPFLNQVLEQIALVTSDPHYNWITNLGAFLGSFFGIFLGLSFWSKSKSEIDLITFIFWVPLITSLYSAIVAIIAIFIEIGWTTWILSENIPPSEYLFNFASLNFYVISDLTVLFAGIAFVLGSFYHFYVSLLEAGINPVFAIFFILASIGLSTTGVLAIINQFSGLFSLVIGGLSTTYLLCVYAYLPWAKHRAKKQFKQKEANLISP